MENQLTEQHPTIQPNSCGTLLRQWISLYQNLWDIAPPMDFPELEVTLNQ